MTLPTFYYHHVNIFNPTDIFIRHLFNKHFFFVIRYHNHYLLIFVSWNFFILLSYFLRFLHISTTINIIILKKNPSLIFLSFSFTHNYQSRLPFFFLPLLLSFTSLLTIHIFFHFLSSFFSSIFSSSPLYALIFMIIFIIILILFIFNFPQIND